MHTKNENLIINLIKYGPVLFIVIVSVIVTNLVLEHERVLYNLQIEKLEKDFVDNNRIRVKDEVEQVYAMVSKKRAQSEELLKKQIKHRVNNAYAIIENIYETNKEQFSKEQILNLIKEAIRPIRFNSGRGYFFIYTLDGINILNAQNTHLEGKNLWKYQDLKGTFLLQEMYKILSVKQETFYDWYWVKKDSALQYKKSGFFKKFAPLNIFIGTGEYIDDFEADIQKQLLEEIQSIRYGKDGYIFVINDKGVTLSHARKHLIGKNTFNEKNYKGEYFIQNILGFANEKQQGYYCYSTPIMPKQEGEDYKKTSFLKSFKPWNWIIGSGFYRDRLYEEINETKTILLNAKNEALQTIIYASIGLTLAFMLLSIYISNVLRSIFDEYKHNLQIEYESNLEKEKMLLQQSKMATMGEMIGNIAHQWKQPLSIINMSSYMIHMNIEQKNITANKDVEDSLINIEKSVKNLTQTIEDFRNFFNPNKKREDYFIQSAVDDTLQLITSQFSSSSIDVIQHIENVEVYGSKNEMLQVLINLLKNAKDELIKKEVYERRLIFIDIKQVEKDLIIYIKDNAGGVKKEYIEKIFEPYITTKEDEGGSGIGLYICKQIVQTSMHGDITVENVKYDHADQEYTGALFTIKIPIKSEQYKTV